jgi:lactoylglutathione lyase
MKIEHIAIWTHNLERLKAFYQTYFGARTGAKYVNPARGFESYFLTFPTGGRLELMYLPSLADRPSAPSKPYVGYAHLAISIGSEQKVNALCAQLQSDGHYVLDGPRRTGDGYYEAVVLDPDGNLLEITL